jgi:hypothetical protein
MIPMAAYRIGIDRVELADGRSFLMAAPEKALADRVVQERGTGITTRKGMLQYLTDNLRIDLAALQQLDAAGLLTIAGAYRSKRLKLLAGLVKQLQTGWQERNNA